MKKHGPGFFLKAVTLFGIAVFALSACGGGGGSSSGGSGEVISGTAAAGAAIIGTATIKDSSVPPKTKSVPIAADGKYSIDVSDLTAPFMLRADGEVGGRRYSLFSAATATDVNGTINITPLTDLIIANIAGDIAANYYNDNNFSGITKEEMDIQIATVTEELLPVLTSLGLDDSINLLRTSFNSDHTGMDAVMDVLKVTIDEETLEATILNVINDSSVTQDIVTNSITGGALDGTGVADGVTTLQQVVDTFTAFSNLFATGLPTPAQLGAIGLFDNTNFLDNGQPYDEFVTDVTTNAPVGLKFSNITLVSAGTDNMVVHFTVMDGSQIEADEEWLFKKDATTGKYLAWGNQRHLGVWLETKADYQPNAPAGQQIQTGINLDIQDPHLYLSGNGVVVITGPGGVNATYVYDISQSYFRQLSNNNGPLIPLDDFQIASIPDVNATYTINLYDNTAGAMTLKDTYTETIGKRPILNSALTPASFPTVTGRTPTTLVGFTGGTVTATWTMPAGLQARYYYVWLNDAGNNANEEKQLSAGDLSGSVTFTPLGWTATMGGIRIGAEDSYGRRLEGGIMN